MTDLAVPSTAVAPDAHRIRARRVRFGWDDTPVHWIPGDPQTTHTINVLHLLLPEGEKWFAHVIRQSMDRIEDPALLDDVKGFVGQESVHSRAHAAVLDHLVAQGIDTRPFTRQVHRMFYGLLGDRPLGRPLPKRLERRWVDLRIAIIAAIEHYTSVLGAWVIDSPGLDAAGADPVMLDLIRWHGAEEVEHRSVAFDLYQHLDGSRVRRGIAMALTTPAIVLLWIAGTGYLLRRDPAARSRLSWRRFRRATRAGRLPDVRTMFATVPGYFGADHHPGSTASTEDALAYLATSPAALAALAALAAPPSPTSDAAAASAG